MLINKIDRLVPVSVNLSKLSDVVKMDVVKKTDYDRIWGWIRWIG